MKKAFPLVFLSIFLLAGVTHFLDLDQFQAADEKRWLARTSGFALGISQLKTDNIYQTHHPGITVQWLATPGVFATSWTGHKLPLVVHSLLVFAIITYLAHQLWGKPTALTVLLLLTINPFFIALRRVLGTDALLAQYLLLWLLLLLLWQKENRLRYLVFSAIAAGLAWLTKLPGVIAIPATLFFITYQQLRHPASSPQKHLPYAVWIVTFMITSCLVLPPLLWSAPNILGDMFDSFSKSSYTDEHAAASTFYLRTLLFFSTPLHLALIILLPLTWKHLTPSRRRQIIWLLAFAAAFTIMMSIGTKKGDRYILPTLVTLDIAAALTVASLWPAVRQKTTRILKLTVLTSIILVVWQITLLPNLHPYYLAYVNPVIKPFFGLRRLGWGEGLDLAAAYLNQKPNVSQLKVATFYPNEFQNYFAGQAVDLHNWETGNIDYAVLYRAQLERDPNSWETDVWEQFQQKQPEKIIQLNGIDYLWIYQLSR